MPVMDQTENKTPKRVRRSRAEIEALLEAQRTSGLTQEAFCREHELNPSTFATWRQKHRAGNADGQPCFAEVRLPPASSGSFAVRLADGTEVFLPDALPPAALAGYVNALRAAPC